MKTLLLTLMLTAGAAFNSKAQVSISTATGAQIEFVKTSHDYGTIKNGADGTCTFEFKNTGNAPLIIQDAKASCGCTVPDWPKTPIAPGETATITVKYDTKKSGVINKEVKVISNASNEPIAILRIKGNVLPVPASSEPIK